MMTFGFEQDLQPLERLEILLSTEDIRLMSVNEFPMRYASNKEPHPKSLMD
jgi:hypothetical protein